MTLKFITLVLTIVVISILLIRFIINISKSEQLLYKKLEEVENDAKNAKSIEEIMGVSNKISELESGCWHKLHHIHISLIKAIIQMKLKNYYIEKDHLNLIK